MREEYQATRETSAAGLRVVEILHEIITAVLSGNRADRLALSGAREINNGALIRQLQFRA